MSKSARVSPESFERANLKGGGELGGEVTGLGADLVLHRAVAAGKLDVCIHFRWCSRLVQDLFAATKNRFQPA